MNRRSFLSFIGLAPVVVSRALAATSPADLILGIDAGAADDTMAVFCVRPSDLAFISERRFHIDDICRFYRVPPDRLGFAS